METGLGSVLSVHKTDREGYPEGVGVLQRHSALKADHVVGRGDVIVGGLHGLFHHLDDGGVLAAESHFCLVVEYELVGCARAADGVDLPAYAFLEKLGLPISRIGDQCPVLKID